MLGELPYVAGLLWTDGVNQIVFEAFDHNGVSLGTIVGNHADASFNRGTADDLSCVNERCHQHHDPGLVPGFLLLGRVRPVPAGSEFDNVGVSYSVRLYKTLTLI